MTKYVDLIAEEFGGHLDIFVANAGIPWTRGAILDNGAEGVRTILPLWPPRV